MNRSSQDSPPLPGLAVPESASHFAHPVNKNYHIRYDRIPEYDDLFPPRSPR
jgi:hypothetical protein